MVNIVRSISVNSGEEGLQPLAIHEWGGGDKAVICVHGLTRNARDFDYLARALEPSYRVLALDMPGRGHSEKLKNPKNYNYGFYANLVAEFLKTEGLEKVRWVGTSMGGVIGMVVAAMNPELISHMVINDIGPHIPAAALDRLATYVGTKIRFASFEEYENELRKILYGFGIKDPDHWRHALEISAQELSDGSYEMLYDPAINHIFRDELGGIKKMEDADLWKVWGMVKSETLILRGTESDILTHETAKRMLETHPAARLIEYEGIGHAPSLMEARQIEDIIRFLEMPGARVQMPDSSN